MAESYGAYVNESLIGWLLSILNKRIYDLFKSWVGGFGGWPNMCKHIKIGYTMYLYEWFEHYNFYVNKFMGVCTL